MFRKRAILVGLVVLICLLSHASPVTPVEAAQWREDLHYFAEQAPQVHKNLFHSMTRGCKIGLAFGGPVQEQH